MKFSQVLALALVGSAAASPIIEGTQDLTTLKTAVEGVTAALTNLDNYVNALTETSVAAAIENELQAKSDGVLAALKSGATSIKSTSAISLTEALQIQATSTKLNDMAAKTVNDLISKKPIIAKTPAQTAKVLKGIQDQSAATKIFIDNLTEKLPQAVRPIAKTLADQANVALAVCYAISLLVRILRNDANNDCRRALLLIALKVAGIVLIRFVQKAKKISWQIIVPAKARHRPVLILDNNNFCRFTIAV
jgi:hypothetical protein